MGLASTQEYIAWVPLDDGDVQPDLEARIGDWIEAASSRIERWCHRTFAQATLVDEPYDGDGTSVLRLRRPPVTSVTSVKVRARDGTFTTVPATDYSLGQDQRTLYLLTLSDWAQLIMTRAVWPQGRGNVLVSYQGGYAVIPEEVKQGCYLATAALQFARGRDPRLLSQAAGTYSMQLKMDVISGLPYEALDLIKAYRLPLIGAVSVRTGVMVREAG